MHQEFVVSLCWRNTDSLLKHQKVTHQWMQNTWEENY